ncbi:SRPBCC domain-containing protein [Uliginosibacterium paludis]|uniref:SRPBCC domain-containing protein n=1 Tax=Uliginosibacterium paludis TaxID=1615952 RepID=A0ABV2CPM0_9RHOO
MNAPASHELVISRLLDAPREQVFRCWIDPAHLARWWLPPGFTNTACEVDPRPGGVLRLGMRSPDGQDYPCEGVFEEVTPPERLVFRGTGPATHPCGSGLPPHSRVTVSLAEEDGRTRLTLHTRFPSPQALAAARSHGFESSWLGALEGFAHYLRQH